MTRAQRAGEFLISFMKLIRRENHKFIFAVSVGDDGKYIVALDEYIVVLDDENTVKEMLTAVKKIRESIAKIPLVKKQIEDGEAEEIT